MKKIILLGTFLLIVSAFPMQNSLANSILIKKEANHQETITRSISASEFEEYTSQVREQIADNDKLMASLLTKLVDDKSKNSKRPEKVIKKLVKSIVVLQLYNDDLRKDLDNYTSYGTGDWRLFKKEFDRDLTELSKDLTEIRMRIYEEFIA